MQGGGGGRERERKMARSFLEFESVTKGAGLFWGDSPSFTVTWCVFQSPNCSGIFSGIFFSHLEFSRWVGLQFLSPQTLYFITNHKKKGISTLAKWEGGIQFVLQTKENLDESGMPLLRSQSTYRKLKVN